MSLDKKIDLIDKSTAEFFEELKKIDNQLALEIIKIYGSFVSGRSLVLDATELAKLEGSIIRAIATTDYKLAVDAFIPNFDAIQALNVNIHKLENGINASKVMKESDKIRNFQSVVEAQLRGSREAAIQVTAEGVKKVTTIPNRSLEKLVDPIADMIRKDVIMGVDFQTATQTMLDAITEGNLGLEQWAGQIGRDALSQADGVQQAAIKEEFDLKYGRYIGTIKDTTRPLCYHLLIKRDVPIYSDDEIEGVLSEYAPGGVPSESPATSTANGKPQKKGAGMIPGTDISNFYVRRGGYNCRHQFIPTTK